MVAVAGRVAVVTGGRRGLSAAPAKAALSGPVERLTFPAAR